MDTISLQKTSPPVKERDYYIDNIKGVFIFLVVFGHLLDFLEQSEIAFATSVRTFIYFFHMPGFIFMSGYLAKSFTGKRFKGEKLLGYAWLYLLFKDSIEILHFVFDRPFFENGSHTRILVGLTIFAAVFVLITVWAYNRSFIFQCAFIAAVVGISLVKVNIFYVGAAPWYLMSLILWHIFIYLTQHMTPRYVMIASVVMMAILDYQDEIGKFLSLSRTINFLPFFLFGFYMTREQFYKIVNNRILKKVLPVFFVLFMVFVLSNGVEIRKAFGVFLYAVSSYEVLPEQYYSFAPFLALIWLVIATILMFALFIICPRKKSRLSTIGQATISIYVLHRLLKDILYYAGFYTILSPNPYLAVGEVGLAALVLVLVFGNSFCAKTINNLGKIKMKWAYKDGKSF